MLFKKYWPVYRFWSKSSKRAVFDQKHRHDPLILEQKMDLKRHAPVYHSLSNWDFQDQLGLHLQFHLQLQWEFQYKSDVHCKPTPVYQIWFSLCASLGAEMELHFKIPPDWGLNPKP